MYVQDVYELSPDEKVVIYRSDDSRWKEHNVELALLITSIDTDDINIQFDLRRKDNLQVYYRWMYTYTLKETRDPSFTFGKVVLPEIANELVNWFKNPVQQDLEKLIKVKEVIEPTPVIDSVVDIETIDMIPEPETITGVGIEDDDVTDSFDLAPEGQEEIGEWIVSSLKQHDDRIKNFEYGFENDFIYSIEYRYRYAGGVKSSKVNLSLFGLENKDFVLFVSKNLKGLSNNDQKNIYPNETSVTDLIDFLKGANALSGGEIAEIVPISEQSYPIRTGSLVGLKNGVGFVTNVRDNDFLFDFTFPEIGFDGSKVYDVREGNVRTEQELNEMIRGNSALINGLLLNALFETPKAQTGGVGKLSPFLPEYFDARIFELYDSKVVGRIQKVDNSYKKITYEVNDGIASMTLHGAFLKLVHTAKIDVTPEDKIILTVGFKTESELNVIANTEFTRVFEYDRISDVN